jgi:site-specific DNA-methyltransferase (adenine-specific)
MEHRLIRGDCFEIFPSIPDKSIDLVLADLPYGTTKNEWDKRLDLDRLWKQYERVIKDNGCIALWAQSPFDKILACSNLKLYRYEWIIQKTHPTGFLKTMESMG